MMKSGAIIGLTDWLQTPAGRHLLEWEQRQLHEGVADVFGFHALQLGLCGLDALATNRMPHRWIATNVFSEQVDTDHLLPGNAQALRPPSPLALHCDFDALPFDSGSLDLVVLPHTLELSADAHQTLREVERVLRPEGRVVIVGFNPVSLWGVRQRMSSLLKRASPTHRPAAAVTAPAPLGELIGYWRLRDWLRLLSFEVESGHFGCYRPPLTSQRWLARLAWIEPLGHRWWPVLGSLYALTAVKRVRAMRLVGLSRDQRTPASLPPPAVAANTQAPITPRSNQKIA